MEVTPGTAVAAIKRLQALSIEPSPQLDIQMFRPMGSKFQALAQAGKDFVQANLSGRASYSDLAYALCSVLRKVTPTTPADTAAREWVFDPQTYAVDLFQTYTVEHGDGRADRFSHGVVTDLSVDFSRDEITVGGGMLGRQLEDPFTLTTAGLSTVEAKPIHPRHVSVYLDTAAAGLGGTKLLRVLQASFGIQNRQGALWVLDRSQDSFVTTVELEPTTQFGLTVEADADGMGLLARARAGDKRFLRVEAVGPVITTAFHEFRVDSAIEFSEVGDFSDQDGVYAINYTATAVHDPTWGKALSVLLRNTLNAL